jgi:hypothetical protein
MLRALNLTVPFANDQMTHRRRRRFAPSLAGATSCLEERVVLSAVSLVANQAPIKGPGCPGTPPNGSVPPIVADPPSCHPLGRPIV